MTLLLQVERFVSSLHSKIEDISTVRERNQSALVTAEDGSVRIISIKSGRSITIMFPLFTALVNC